MNPIWEAAGVDLVGGRREQEDSFGVLHSLSGESCLLLVADGMGGHRGGGLASQTLLEIAERNWDSCGGVPADAREFLEDLCQEAHEEVNLRGWERGLEPHSTVVALVVEEAEAVWVHVGDSRLYHFRGRQLLERTMDHSAVQLLVEAGEVSESEIATHPDQNKLLRSIGGRDRPKTSHGSAEMQPQDRFLLCSDGFWEWITPEEMAAALEASKLDDALRQLAGLAVERGGANSDNVAVAAVRVLDRVRDPGAVVKRSGEPDETPCS